MKRGSPMRRTPLRRRSAKQQALYDVRVPIIREAMAEGVLCQAGIRIADFDLEAANRCRIRAQDWHEKLSRARGGSITDPANRLWVCRPCHDWIGANPALAERAGLAVSAFS